MHRTEQADGKMPSQIPAFRLTVARRMEPKALRERVGRRIRAARLHEGLEARDLAYKLKTDPRTIERWEAGEVYPQLRNRKALVEELNGHLTLDDLQPDLEAEERELRDQLDRVEGLLRRLARALDVDPDESLEDEATRIADEAAGERRAAQRGSERRAASS